MYKLIPLLFLCCSISTAHAQVDTILWLVDNLNEIGGHSVQILGNPTVIETEIGFAVEFDGIDDGLIVDGNPMAGATTAFTVEIIFKPYSGGEVEQRFLHCQQDNDNRILIELRNNADENWSLDTFIKSGSSSQALLDYAFVHDLDTWVHAALIYDNGVMEHYVNGEKELEGTVDYQEVSFGETSLGVRLNQVSWYKGAIYAVRVTHEVLDPAGFMEIPSSTTGLTKVPAADLNCDIQPNPIHHAGQLSFELPEAAALSVKLLDSTGQEVAMLFEGFQQAGKHELEIKRGANSPGIYLLAIEYQGRQYLQRCVFD